MELHGEPENVPLVFFDVRFFGEMLLVEFSELCGYLFLFLGHVLSYIWDEYDEK